jgi:hypothetical protein
MTVVCRALFLFFACCAAANAQPAQRCNGVAVPAWLTGERPSGAVLDGTIGYNRTLGMCEAFDAPSGAWSPMTASGATLQAVAANVAGLLKGQIAPRVNIGAWSVAGTTNPGTAGIYSNAAAGHVGFFSVEVPDDFDAVQIGMENDNGASAAVSWNITQAVATASSSYGNGSSVPGATAYDSAGAVVTTMLPFQFANAGANSAPFAGLAGMAGAGVGQPGYVMALATSASTGAGTASLSFTSTTSPRNTALSTPAAAGWFVADGLGCIAPAVTIATINATTITLTGNGAAAVGCGSGQEIWVSPVPFATFGQTVGAIVANGPDTVAYSDWMALSSIPRTDGGFATGNVMSLSGTNLAGGTTMQGVTPTSLLLSAPTAGIVAANTPVTVSFVTATTQAVSNDYIIPVAATAGIQIGQAVYGGGIPASSTVSGVDPAGKTVTIYNAPTTLPTVASGVALTFSTTIWTSAAAASGATALPVVSTTRHRLLNVRFFLGPNAPSVNSSASCAHWGDCGTTFTSIPQVFAGFGGQNAGNAWDGLNFVSLVGNGVGGPAARQVMPNFFLRFVTRHPAITTLQCGGFQASGADTADRQTNALKIASAALSTANLPIFSINAGGTTQTSGLFARCSEWIKSHQPSIVSLWTYSDRGPDTLQTYMSGVMALAQQAQNYGGRVILMTDAPEQVLQIGGIITPAANNQTVITLPYAALSLPFGGSGYLINGGGLPPGTTAAFSSTYPAVMTLSNPLTAPAGTVLHLAFQVGTNSSGTTVTLAFPSPVSTGLAYNVVGTGVTTSPATTITATKDSTTATLNQAANLTNGQSLTIGHYPDPSAGNIAALNEPMVKALAGRFSVFDTRTAYYNPASPMYMCDGCSFNGIYNSEYGEAQWAAGLQAIMQQMIGGQ